MSGLLNSKDILNTFDRAVSDEKYKPGMGRIWDFTDIDLSSIDSDAIPKMARHSLSFPPGISDVKVAFVVTKTMEYGLTRMFKAYSDTYAKTKVNIFKTIEEAENWLMEESDSSTH